MLMYRGCIRDIHQNFEYMFKTDLWKKHESIWRLRTGLVYGEHNTLDLKRDSIYLHAASSVDQLFEGWQATEEQLTMLTNAIPSHIFVKNILLGDRLTLALRQYRIDTKEK